jgi:hypothetical protein
MRVLRWIGLLLAVAIVGLLVWAGLARLSDGPLGFFPGGPLEAGPLVPSEGVDWAFAARVNTIELQLLQPPRSRTVWVVHEEGALYIPCGLPNFRLWKRWPHEAMKDGRAVVRIEGKRYPVTIERVEDPSRVARVLERVSAKYGTDPGAQDRGVWVFRVAARPRS